MDGMEPVAATRQKTSHARIFLTSKDDEMLMKGVAACVWALND